MLTLTVLELASDGIWRTRQNKAVRTRLRCISYARRNPLTTVRTPFPWDMDVETALRATRALYSDHEVRILNRHRPKRVV